MRDRAHICFEDKFEISRAGNQFLQVLSGIVAAGRKMGPFNTPPGTSVVLRAGTLQMLYSLTRT